MVPGRHIHFQGEHIRPLCHLSGVYLTTIAIGFANRTKDEYDNIGYIK